MSIFTQQVEALQFHLLHIAKLSSIQQLEKYQHVESDMINMMLEQAERFSEEVLFELAAKADIEGCHLDNGKVSLPSGTAEAYQQWCELGFPTLGLPIDFDGLDFPKIVQCAIQELGDSANLSFGMLPINIRCAALALIKHAPQELSERWLPGLVSGEITSTIAISEPQAGSDVGRILVKANPTEDGTWLINGSKIWISYGDHDASKQIIHLVLARVPGDIPGTKGLGLFVVPKYNSDDISEDSRNGVSPTRLEHKMGLHASPTCVLEFENAQAYLIGEPTQGIQQLFVMMNAMRLAVAVQGSALANAATLHAIEYAKERPQGGNPNISAQMISEHEDVKRMLLEMTAGSEMLRALSLRTASYLDLAEANDDAETSNLNRKIGELLLPLAKTIGAESAFEIINQGIQVLGGYGYTNDYPLERMLRDIRVASIYEGTSGIQALDFMKRKVIGDQAATLDLLLQEIKLDLENSATNNPLHAPLQKSLNIFENTIASLLEKTKTDKQASEAGAYAFLKLAGLLVCGWNGLTLYQAATSNTAYQNRLKAALTLFSNSLESEAKLWAQKSLQSPINFKF